MNFVPKYNPRFQTDQEIIDSFVVRHHILDLILETIQGNTGSVNQHILIVGPRGSGKSTLVHRVAAALETDHDLSAKWYPIPFAEESYLVTTPGEFWLEALFHLSELTQDPRWQQIAEELRKEPDEKRLQDRALSQLLDFSDYSGKRILLIVENLNMLLGEQMSSDSDWDLRHTLQTEPRLMLLGTATSRFDQISNVDKAWFEFFSIYSLDPLDLSECRILWEAITGDQLTDHRLRPMQILTGGNPRLLRILAEFSAQRSLQELMKNLIQLVDDHTDYFKGQMDHLAPVERKVFVALLDAWDPLGAREVAEIARIGVNKASSLLNRLVLRGAVVILEEGKRRKLYQVSERLFNIYYLMRRRGYASIRVQAVVNFLVSFYEREELFQVISDIMKEVSTLEIDQCEDHVLFYKLLAPIIDRNMKDKLARKTPPNILKGLIKRCSQDLQKDPCNYEALRYRGIALSLLGQHEDALEDFDYALMIKPDHDRLWNNRGNALSSMGRNQEALESYERCIEINSKHNFVWNNRGVVLRDLSQHQEALESYERCIKINPNWDPVWFNKGLVLKDLNRYEEAIESFDHAIKINPDEQCAWDEWLSLLDLLRTKGEWEQVLELLSPLFMEPIVSLEIISFQHELIKRITDLLIATTAAGYAQEVLNLIQSSKAMIALEPLIVGIRIYLGETVRVAQEIAEIGQDVSQQIRDQQTILEQRSPLGSSLI